MSNREGGEWRQHAELPFQDKGAMGTCLILAFGSCHQSLRLSSGSACFRAYLVAARYPNILLAGAMDP
eukprot:1204659-Amphidinium_carterae.2